MNKKIPTILFCVSLVLFSILLSYKAIFLATDFTPAQQEWITYFENEGNLPANYTSAEYSHMEDVKRVLFGTDIVFYISLLLVTLFITYYKRQKNRLKEFFMYGGITIATFVGVVGLFALFSFMSAFTFFHALFFPQGNWQFAPDSLLIATWPLDFFSGFAIKTIALAFVWGILFIVVARYTKHDR